MVRYVRLTLESRERLYDDAFTRTEEQRSSNEGDRSGSELNWLETEMVTWSISKSLVKIESGQGVESRFEIHRGKGRRKKSLLGATERGSEMSLK